LKLHFRWVREAQPGPRWAQLFEQGYPAYSEWFLAEGDAARPDLATCRQQLLTHMPELVPIWERLVALSGGSDQAARMLSLYRPSPYLAGCSQAVRTAGGPLLVRNYDYHPGACEGTFLLTSWTGTRVMAASDCLWGVLDGMNEHGLVVALSFGGRRIVGDGFGIPLVLRYVLETCRRTEEATHILKRIPSHMAYNVSVLDAAGDHRVAYLAPDRKTLVVKDAVATNHQREVEWSRYDAFTQSAERERFLDERVRDASISDDAFIDLFLGPPLYATKWERAYGTLYTAAYRPVERTASFLWPHGRVDQSLDAFHETNLVVPYGF
jgi:predicted choloylglycine hydrolase